MPKVMLRIVKFFLGDLTRQFAKYYRHAIDFTET